MTKKKFYVFEWPAWLTSGFSGNLALEMLHIVIICKYCILFELLQIRAVPNILFVFYSA